MDSETHSLRETTAYTFAGGRTIMSILPVICKQVEISFAYFSQPYFWAKNEGLP